MSSIMPFGKIDNNISMDMVFSASISKNSTPIDIQSLIYKQFDYCISKEVLNNILSSEPEYIDVRGYDKHEQEKFLHNYLLKCDYKTIIMNHLTYQMIYRYQVSLLPNSSYGMTIGGSSIIVMDSLKEYEIIFLNDSLFSYNLSLEKYTNESDLLRNSDYYKQKFGYKIDYSNVKLINYIDKPNQKFIQEIRNKNIEKILS